MKLIYKIENAYLNPELKKSDVRRLTKAGVLSGEITPNDQTEVESILADRDMCAEDALDALRCSAHNIMESSTSWEEHILQDPKVLSFALACMNAAKAKNDTPKQS